METTIVRDLVLLYALALGAVVVLSRLRMPPTIALVLAGVLAGPSGLGVVDTGHEVDLLAEIGIVLLLFTVGLDFPLSELRRLWKTVVGGGLLQLGLTAALVLALVTATGATLAFGLFVGLFVAMSSTAVVVRGLGERNELDAPHGRLAVGVLLFQDLAFVVVLLLVPALAGRLTPAEVPALLGRAFGALVAVAIVGRTLLPALFRIAIASRRREAFTLALLVASVGTAWACAAIGLPTAVGAFLGGFVLAESEFSHQAQAEIRPLRDVLASLFFISLGMLIDLPAMSSRPVSLLALVLAVVSLKAVAAAVALAVLRVPLRVAAGAGVALAQVGEFSFIFGRAGVDAGLVGSDAWQILLSVSMATLLVTPALLSAAPGVMQAVSRARGGHRAQPDEMAPGEPPGVVILGYGLGGQLIAPALAAAGRTYRAMELNGATVRRARADGQRVTYGDATNPEALVALGVAGADAVAVVLSDPEATRRAVKAVRHMAPAVPVIVRTRYRLEAERLRMAGATVVVAEEIETSLEVLAQLLDRLGLPGNRVLAVLETLRHEATVRPMRPPSPSHLSLPDALRDAAVASHEVDAGDWAEGRSIADTQLRRLTGASVVAMARGDRYLTMPPPAEHFEPGDIVYLLGSASAVAAARARLRAGSSSGNG